MGTIIGIGGGDIVKKNTFEIDKKIIEISKKKNPHVLFVPTASSDNDDYCNTFLEYYQSLGADVKFLKLISESQTEKEIEKILDWADIIYIGGGNTIKLIDKLKERNIDKKFAQMFSQKNNKVLCGLSAGCLCWFEYGMTDSIPGKWTFVSCLNLVRGVASVGFSRPDDRSTTFKNEFSRYGNLGFGFDDLSAIIITNKGQYYSIKTLGKVHQFIRANDDISEK